MVSERFNRELLLVDDRTTCARPFFSPSNQAYDVATISGPRAFRSSARSDGDASDGDASDARDGDASDVDARARRARAALTRSFTTPRRAGAPVRGEEHGSGAFFRYNMGVHPASQRVALVMSAAAPA